jgi:hypothetical protein
MRGFIIFVFLLLLLPEDSYTQSIEGVFPSIAFDQTRAEVYFNELPADHFTHLVQVFPGTDKKDSLLIQSSDEGFYVEPTFSTSANIVFDQVEISGEQPNVIPLWTSVLPPLIAIF